MFVYDDLEIPKTFVCFIFCLQVYLSKVLMVQTFVDLMRYGFLQGMM